MPNPLPIKVSFVNSIFYQRDGVSLNMRDQIRALTEAPERPYDIQIFVGETNFDDPRIRVTRDSTEILRSEHFRSSQIVIFQWGVYYDHYNIIFAIMPHQRTLTYFHNTTPSHFFSNPEVRASIERGEKQIDNIFYSDFVFCNSAFSMNDLIDRGVLRERLDVLWPVHFVPRPPKLDRPEARAAQLLYVGRFVPHKGARELLLAVAKARRAGSAPLHLRLIGALRYSDRSYIDELMAIIAAEDLQDSVTFLGELSDSALGAEYARAHALVMPSFHEGFCLPVIEALNCGCYVIAFDGGNLPFLVRDLGTLIPAGDVNALSEALADFAARVAHPVDRRRYRTVNGDVSISQYEREATEEASRYISYDAFKKRFILGVEKQLRQIQTAPGANSDVFPNYARIVCQDDSGEDYYVPLGDRLARLEEAFAYRRKVGLAAQNIIGISHIDARWHAKLFRASKTVGGPDARS